MDFSYIIPFKYTDDRFLTLIRVLDNIKELDCEIIIVEQGDISVLPSKNIETNIKYIFLENKLPFNKSWALNVGYKEAKYEKIVFGDADNLIDVSKIIEGLSELDNVEMVSPHIRLIDLSKEESHLSNDDIFKIHRPGRGEVDIQKMTFCGAMTIFRKEALDKISGWPEEFFGWGAEDDAMTIKVKHFLSWKCLGHNCYHLWHERVNPDRDFYYRNLSIYNNYINAPKQAFLDHIEKTKNIIGDKNKKMIL